MDYTFDKTKKYALAVSGGIDSMVMLHYVTTILPTENIVVVTVNHGIRKHAQKDCDVVLNYCNKLGVNCIVKQIDVPSYCNDSGLSLETGARLLRYQQLDSIDADYVCLAHHNDDNVETILMHLLRGSGANGVVGIKQVSGKYVRPLLFWTRSDIVAYAKEHNVPYVIDKTNNQTKYKRNYVRHKVLPTLSKVNSNAKQNITKFAQSIAQDDEYLNSLADISSVTFGKNFAKVPKQLLTQRTPIAYRVLHKVFTALNVYYDIETSHLQALCSLANNVGGKKISLPFGYTATNDYDVITIEKSTDNTAKEVCVPFAVGNVDTPFGTVCVSKEKLPNSLYFDITKVPTNAVIRTRKIGDVFTKFGGGTKPLKKYLIDKKIPQRTRDDLLLVADGNQVLIIIGVEISDNVRVDNNDNMHYITIQQKR